MEAHLADLHRHIWSKCVILLFPWCCVAPNPVNTEINLTVTCQTTGWVALGLSYSGVMTDSDIIWGQVL